MGNELTKLMVRETLLQVSPHEMLLVDTYDPSSKLYGKTSRGPQGIGIETATFLLLPYLYKFFEKFLEKLVSNAADDAYKITKKWLASDKGESDELRKVIHNQLAELGLPVAELDKVTNGIIETLKKRAGDIAPKA